MKNKILEILKENVRSAIWENKQDGKFYAQLLGLENASQEIVDQLGLKLIKLEKGTIMTLSSKSFRNGVAEEIKSGDKLVAKEFDSFLNISNDSSNYDAIVIKKKKEFYTFKEFLNVVLSFIFKKPKEIYIIFEWIK